MVSCDAQVFNCETAGRLWHKTIIYSTTKGNYHQMTIVVLFSHCQGRDFIWRDAGTECFCLGKEFFPSSFGNPVPFLYRKVSPQGHYRSDIWSPNRGIHFYLQDGWAKEEIFLQVGVLSPYWLGIGCFFKNYGLQGCASRKHLYHTMSDKLLLFF